MQPYGPYRPDAATPNSGYAVQADNAQPSLNGQQLGYAPFPALVEAVGAEALSEAPRGIISLIKFDGTYAVYVGTSSTIEQMDSSYQFSSVATGLNVTAGDDMSFCHFGSYLLNTNTTDGLAAYNVETPGTNDAVSGAPKARFVFSANNVVILLDCDDNNRRMQTSGIGDHTAWDSGGADGKTFEDGGALVGGVDLQNGVALLLQTDAVRVMQFGGAPGGALYTISKVADGLGAIGPRSLVGYNGRAWWLSSRGFYEYAAGGAPTPIGAEKVDTTFLKNIAVDDLRTVQAWLDPERNLVGWRYRRNGVSSTYVFEDNICYNYVLKEWFTLSVDAAVISRIATAGYTVDGPYADILVDDNPTPVDDRLYQGGAPVMAALDADLKFATFSGTPLAATLETALINSGTTSLINSVTPIDDCAAGTLAVGYSDRLDASLVWNSGQSKARNGATPQRARGMNLAFKRVIPAGSSWTYATGVDYAVQSQGGRK